MEVTGNAAGLDLGKRTYEMCLISNDNKAIRTGGKTDPRKSVFTQEKHSKGAYRPKNLSFR